MKPTPLPVPRLSYRAATRAYNRAVATENVLGILSLTRPGTAARAVLVVAKTAPYTYGYFLAVVPYRATPNAALAGIRYALRKVATVVSYGATTRRPYPAA